MKAEGRLAIMILGMALLASCDRAPSGREDGYTPTAAVDPAARLRALPEKDLLQLAFKSAFNGEDGAMLTLGDTRYAFKPEGISWVGNRAVLISGGQGDDCHGCAGTLAVHYLQPRGDGFEVVGAWPQAASGTSFGAPPHWQLRTDLASNPVLQAEGGGTNQGYSCTAAELVELRPDAPVTIADEVQLSYSDRDAVPKGGAQIEGKILPGARDKDFVVAYQGTSNARVTYARSGATYRKQPGGADIPSC